MIEYLSKARMVSMTYLRRIIAFKPLSGTELASFSLRSLEVGARSFPKSIIASRACKTL